MGYAQMVNVSDIPISTVSGNHQVENAVFISPLSKYVIINSNNSSPVPNPPIAQGDVSYFISTDGAQTWTGNINGIDTDGYGDPSVVIDRTGRILVSYLSYLPSPRHLTVSYTDDNGGNWTTIQVPGTFVNADKQHLWVDNNLNSPYEGRIYMAFNDQSINCCFDIVFTYSTDGGASWLTPPLENISSTVSPPPLFENLGVNIQTGPQGQVYTCWSAIDYGYNTIDNTRIYFNKSLDGGDTWLTNAKHVITVTGAGSPLGGGKWGAPKAYPFMAVNQQTGTIYLVWTTNNGILATLSTDADIYMIKSEDEGATWSAPIRVNQDLTGNFKDQWSPGIACDEISNALVVEYYDSRNFPANPATNRAETFVSISYDDGNTWQDHRISDPGEHWSGNASSIPGQDYMQIDVYHGFCVPVWSDNRPSAGSDFRAYTNPFEVPCPQNLDLIYGDYDIFDQGTFTYDAAYSASGSINVAGVANNSTYRVYPGANVVMTAGNDVLLDAGFYSEGEFYAYTAPCTNFSQRVDNSFNQTPSAPPTPFAFKQKNIPIVEVFPNPSTGKFQLAINSDQLAKDASSTYNLTVSNILGEIIYTVTNQSISPSAKIDLSSKPKGIYFVKVQSEDRVYSEKVVIQ